MRPLACAQLTRQRAVDLLDEHVDDAGVTLHPLVDLRPVLRSAALIVADNLSLLTLPPDSPELNPVENVWYYLRANWLAIRVFDSCDAILDACCTAWNHFANNPKTVTSITERPWAQVG
jgi:transposase